MNDGIQEDKFLRPSIDKERFDLLKRTFYPRFWDTYSKCMIYPQISEDKERVVYITELLSEDKPREQDLSYFLHSHRYIKMKPSAVNAISGAVVYEEDVVIGLLRDEEKHLGVIKYYNGCFFAISDTLPNTNCSVPLFELINPNDSFSNFDVIGNQYEHPDLVKVAEEILGEIR